MKKTVLLFVISLWGFLNLHGQEENVISLYIYNFTRYIDWPGGGYGESFTIDVIGHKSVYEKLKEYTANRKAGNKSIVVRYLETASAITQSDILFVGFYQSKEIAKVLEKVGSSKTLIIGEKDGMIDNGAGINFIIRNEAIKFEIKPSNIQKNGLKVADDLLKLAVKIY
jgi:hypothetical protein